MDFRRLQSLYNERERRFLLLKTPREWETHLLSLGVRRYMEADAPRHFILWSDSMRDWLAFPEDFCERVLTLGFMP